MAREIPLTKGYVAVVDDEDFGAAYERKWFVATPGGRPYAAARVGGRWTYLHRFLTNAQPGVEVDHISGDTLDNRRSNLRLTSRSQNAWNAAKRQGAYSSKFKGVSYDKRRSYWVAYADIGGKRTYLGRFDDEVAAARAYDAKARELFGAFAALNFPEDGERGCLS